MSPGGETSPTGRRICVRLLVGLVIPLVVFVVLVQTVRVVRRRCQPTP
jgi:hypothetical protein